MLKKVILFLLLSPYFGFCQINLNEVIILENKKQTDTIIGIDVSRYQGNIDWANLDTTIKFAIIKVSEGVSKVDIRFQKNWDNCPVLKGGYHFFRPQSSGVQQAKLFLKTLPIDTGIIIPCIDVEYTRYWLPKRNRKKAVANLKSMIEKVVSEIKTEPIIYTSKHFWEHYVFPHYKEVKKLWVVDYRNISPMTPNNVECLIWQYTNKGKIDGIKTFVDMNICPNKTLIIYE